MSHQFQSGFFVQEAAWHKLGKVIQNAPTTREGIELAGLNWTVRTEPLFMNDQRMVDHKAVVRDDNDTVLGVVGQNWTPLQNHESFEFFDDFIATGEVQLEAAGALRQGRTTWVLAKIKNATAEVVKNDPIERYFLLSNGHDGKKSVSLGFTDTRVVCQNTLSFAEETSRLVRMFHSKNVRSNIESIKQTIDMTRRAFVADLDRLQTLKRSGINQKDIEKYVEVLFFKGKDLTKTRTQNKFKTTLEKIEELIETGMGADIHEVQGTKYGLYNAATEFISHYAIEDDDSRLNQLWFGRLNKMNERAYSELVTL